MILFIEIKFKEIIGKIYFVKMNDLDRTKKLRATARTLATK